MSISGQIVSEIVAQLYSENSIQTLLIFFGSTQKKFRRVCMEFSKHNWATISNTKKQAIRDFINTLDDSRNNTTKCNHNLCNRFLYKEQTS